MLFMLKINLLTSKILLKAVTFEGFLSQTVNLVTETSVLDDNLKLKME
jgi:hypothetical protein